jgi:uncharacterized Tic20 family protein
VSDQQPSDPFAAPTGDQPPPSVSPPPYGSAPPPPGYAPGYAGEQPLSQSDERMWALLAHLSIFVLSLIGPILILVLLGKRSAFVADQAKEALNFHITVLIASFISFLLCFVLVGFVLLPLVIVGSMVLGVLAAVQAHQGVAYRYPLTLRLVP